MNTLNIKISEYDKSRKIINRLIWSQIILSWIIYASYIHHESNISWSLDDIESFGPLIPYDIIEIINHIIIGGYILGWILFDRKNRLAIVVLIALLALECFVNIIYGIVVSHWITRGCENIMFILSVFIIMYLYYSDYVLFYDNKVIMANNNSPIPNNTDLFVNKLKAQQVDAPEPAKHVT